MLSIKSDSPFSSTKELSIYTRLWILSFAEKRRKNIGKNLSGKYSQKIVDQVKQSATDVPKTASKRVVKKISETTDDLIGNKNANKITKIWSTLSQIYSDSVINETKNIGIYREIPKERYISPENIYLTVLGAGATEADRQRQR